MTVADATIEKTAITRGASWGATCILTDTLCWDQHGRRHGWSLPEWWTPEHLATVKELANSVQPPAPCYEINEGEDRGDFYFVYRFWDSANLWVEAWEVTLVIQRQHAPTIELARKQAQDYVLRGFNNHVRLHNGTMAALLFYKETGEARMPDWVPESQLYTEKENGKGKERIYKRVSDK